MRSLNICIVSIKNTRNTHRSITSEMSLYAISCTVCVYNKHGDSKIMSTEQQKAKATNLKLNRLL